MSFKIIHPFIGSAGATGQGTVRPRAFMALVALLMGAGVLARVLALPRLLPDLDAVNFARSLRGFDLASQAPHFPGYPVYVAMARVASAAGAYEVLALVLPGLVLGAVAIGVLGAVLRPYLGAAGALVASALMALLPLPVLFGATPGSDGAGLALLAMAACAVLVAGESAPRAVVAGVVVGVALGARPSFLPALVGLALAVPRGRRGAAFVGCVLGVAAWLVPLVVLTGPVELLRIGSGFLRGHAGEWGGTVAVRPDLGWRLENLGFDIVAAGLGLPWPGVGGDSAPVLVARVVLALAFGGALVTLGLAAPRGALSSGERRVALLALSFGVPYGVWMFLGQNLLKARHALPVVLALALLAAVGVSVLARFMASQRLPFLAGATLAVSAAGVMLPVAIAQGEEPSPAARLVAHVASTLPPAGTLLFTGEEARLFEHYVPHYRAGRPATAEQLRHEVERVAAAGANVYVTSTAPGFEALAPHLEPVSRFACDRRVRSHAYEIILFHYRPAPPPPPEKVL